ncbi:RNA polymerase sigma-70 factor (ECF subfamily) [Desulfitispora alkaliphila]|uniref:RNA polymerase sigma factor n=1 Tax=Desulfitispora alkaliphila TaxID=622674 RepID=UPI003D262DB7
MLLSEEELIDKSQHGDVDAFEELIARHEKRIYSIAYRIMGNHEDASDLAQEALVKIFKSIKKFRGEAAFSTWVYHIVANVCRDQMRKKRIPTTSIDEPVQYDDKSLVRQLEGKGYSPEEVVEQKELQQYMQRAIDQLPYDYKIVLIMRELMELSYEEIAYKLNINLGTVKSRLSRGRRMLRDKLLAGGEQLPMKYRQIK